MSPGPYLQIYSQVISSRSGETNGMTEPNKPKVVLFGGRFLVNG